jgi:hypothetical protein
MVEDTNTLVFVVEVRSCDTLFFGLSPLHLICERVRAQNINGTDFGPQHVIVWMRHPSRHGVLIPCFRVHDF